jgi:hypothetical protein
MACDPATGRAAGAGNVVLLPLKRNVERRSATVARVGDT